MAVIYNLDENAANVVDMHLVEDLTYPFSILEVSFRVSADFDPAKQPEFRFLNNDWKVLTGQVQTNIQARQVLVLAYHSAATQTVEKTIATSSDLRAQLKLSAAKAGFQQFKFKTPVHGDTYAAIMNRLIFQSFEENVDRLSSALCLSATTQGLFATSWRSLGTVKGIFSETDNPMKPTIVQFRDANDYMMNHTALPRVQTLESYYNRLFGSKLEVQGSMLLSLGVSYTFNTDILGFKQQTPLLLTRQELFQRNGQAKPVKQLFVEVQDV